MDRRKKEDMGYWTRECFHFKEELRKNITPLRDKGKRVKGRKTETGEGLRRL